ncbi:hypothetical protein Y046_3862 [Burkholderia pseudomallei MSHR2990]|nr:hypothetical protein Y046_3862 [Burkholderia pseudomallei MSHR2990]
MRGDLVARKRDERPAVACAACDEARFARFRVERRDDADIGERRLRQTRERRADRGLDRFGGPPRAAADAERDAHHRAAARASRSRGSRGRGSDRIMRSWRSAPGLPAGRRMAWVA